MPDLSSTDDRLGHLMRQAQGGDNAAYAALLHELAPRIRRVIARRRGFAGNADVEDLVQDVLLSVHRVRGTYDASRPLMPWVLAIVQHRLADGARRYARRARWEVGLDDEAVTIADPAANPDRGRADDVEAVQEAVRALPDGQRQAIELLKLQELSLKEASARSGASVGSLKVATHRAMATLRKAFRERRP